MSKFSSWANIISSCEFGISRLTTSLSTLRNWEGASTTINLCIMNLDLERVWFSNFNNMHEKMGACLFPPLKLRQIRICTTSSKLLASVFRRSCFSLLCEWGSASQILMMIKKKESWCLSSVGRRCPWRYPEHSRQSWDVGWLARLGSPLLQPLTEHYCWCCYSSRSVAVAMRWRWGWWLHLWAG